MEICLLLVMHFAIFLILGIVTTPCLAAQATHPHNKVTQLILSLPDVKAFKVALDKAGRSNLGVMVEHAPSKQRPYYIIKVYENFPDRVVTFHRYRYTPSTKEIAVQDLSSDEEWKVIEKRD